MNNQFLFLDLFGNIDDSLIAQSFLPWEDRHNSILYKYRNKIACAILTIILAGGCIFHTEVEAAMRKVATLISEMLGIEEDISSFTEIQNIPVTINGLTLTLEEVVFSDDQLVILISQTFDEDKKVFDTEIIEDLKVNGKKAGILKDTITDATVNTLAQKYVFSYYLDEDIAITNMMEIEAAFTVRRADNSKEIGKYVFKFKASPDELENNTISIPVNQSIHVPGQDEIKLVSFKLNSIESNITATCTDLPLGAEYYLKGKDNFGNQVIYRLLSYDNPKLVFVNEVTKPISPNVSSIELQLYKHSLGKLIYSYEDDEVVEEDFVDENVSQMEKVGESFTINIR